MSARPVFAVLLSWLLLLAATVPGVARAACPSPTQPLVVDLSLRVGEPAVQVGDLIEVELVARSSDPILSQSVAGLDAIIAWDSTVLAFCTNGSSGVPSSCEPGVVDGDYNWNGLVGPFVDDTNVDGLNIDLTDGLILYSAFSQFGNPAIAPPEGMVVARFSFRALSVTANTVIELIPSAGLNTCTQIPGGDEFGQIVTGGLEATQFAVCDAGNAGDGDTDDDGDVDLYDISDFTTCYLQSGAALEPRCTVFDLNCDAAVNGEDYTLLAGLMTGP